jgi:hypothetical protein
MKRRDDIEHRRAELIARLAQEREEIRSLLGRIEAPVKRAEHVKERTEEVAKRYAALWVPVAMLALLRSKRVLGWLAHALPVYHIFRAWRRVSRVAAPLKKQKPPPGKWRRLVQTTSSKVSERLNGRSGRSA